MVFGFFRNRRRAKIRKGLFSSTWVEILRQNIPIYLKLTADDRLELQGHILVFLDEKTFEGCGGLEIDDEIRVTIAAQACLLLLHREPAYYPTLRTILVYPSSYLAKNPYDENNQAHRLGRRRRATAWPGGGVGRAQADVPVLGAGVQPGIRATAEQGGQGQKDGDRPLRRHQPGRVFRDGHRGVFREAPAIEKE